MRSKVALFENLGVINSSESPNRERGKRDTSKRERRESERRAKKSSAKKKTRESERERNRSAKTQQRERFELFFYFFVHSSLSWFLSLKKRVRMTY